MLIRLPAYVFEADLSGLLSVIWQPMNDAVLAIDFTRIKYYIPAAVTVLITRIDHANRMNIEVELHGLETCENFRYLQRIDFFDNLGLELPEDFKRHDAGNAFVPLREIVPGPVTVANESIPTDLARCVADHDGNDVFQLSQYALGEVIANLKQHACERGFVCAQYSQKQEMARIGIADSGIGIRESFRRTSAPHYREEMTDGQVLELAMSLHGSSKAHLRTAYGESANRGVGLTITRFMVAESYGHFFIASGTAWWYRNGFAPEKSGTLANGARVEGTVLSLGYNRFQVSNYAELRQQAWEGLGLTAGASSRNLFT